MENYKSEYEKRMDVDDAEVLLRCYFHPQATLLRLEHDDIKKVRDAIMTILYTYYEQKEKLEKAENN